MNWKHISENCERRYATPDEVQEYRNEKDPDRRLNLAYEYQITHDDLYPEDYQAILKDVHDSLNETMDNPN